MKESCSREADGNMIFQESNLISKLMLPLSIEYLYIDSWGFKKIILFIFGCAGSSLLHGLFLVAASGGHSLVAVLNFSFKWLLFLQRTGSRAPGFQQMHLPGSRSAGSIVVVHMLSCPRACEIFPDQGSNPCLLHWQADSLPRSHQGSLFLSFKSFFFFFFFNIHIYVCVCVFDNNPFQMCLFIYFFPVYGLSSYSLTLSFTKQKFLLLLKSSLSVIYCIEQTFGIISRKAYHIQGHLVFLLCFLLGFFIVLHFTLRFLLHFELILRKSIYILFFFLPVCECIVVPAPFVEKTIFALLQGFPTPRPWTGTGPGPLGTRAIQQGVSGSELVSEVPSIFIAVPHHWHCYLSSISCQMSKSIRFS